MPLRGIILPDGREVSWQTYLQTDGPGIYPRSIREALYKSSANERDRWVSVSVLSYCLRKAKWEYENDYYLRQKDAYYLMRGNLIHGVLSAEDASETALIEHEVQRQIPGSSLVLRGRIDKWDHSVLYDYKTIADNGLHLLKKEGAKEAHIWQVNIYAWILRGMKVPINDIKLIYLSMGNVMVTGDVLVMSNPKTQRDETFKIPPVPIFPDDKIVNYIAPKLQKLEQGYAPEAEPQEWMCKICYFRDRCATYVGKGDAKVTPQHGDFF